MKCRISYRDASQPLFLCTGPTDLFFSSFFFDWLFAFSITSQIMVSNRRCGVIFGGRSASPPPRIPWMSMKASLARLEIGHLLYPMTCSQSRPRSCNPDAGQRDQNASCYARKPQRPRSPAPPPPNKMLEQNRARKYHSGPPSQSSSAPIRLTNRIRFLVDCSSTTRASISSALSSAPP